MLNRISLAPSPFSVSTSWTYLEVPFPIDTRSYSNRTTTAVLHTPLPPCPRAWQGRPQSANGAERLRHAANGPTNVCVPLTFDFAMLVVCCCSVGGMVWPCFCSRVGGVGVDGRINRCFARYKTMNPPQFNGQNQLERLEPGVPWRFVVIFQHGGALAKQRCRCKVLFVTGSCCTGKWRQAPAVNRFLAKCPSECIVAVDIQEEVSIHCNVLGLAMSSGEGFLGSLPMGRPPLYLRKD